MKNIYHGLEHKCSIRIDSITIPLASLNIFPPLFVKISFEINIYTVKKKKPLNQMILNQR